MKRTGVPPGGAEKRAIHDNDLDQLVNGDAMWMLAEWQSMLSQ